MKNFDKERFVQLLKYDVVRNWRNHVSFAIGAFLAHFAVQFGMIYFSVKNMYNSLPERAGNICRDAASISFVVSYIVFSVALSLMFANLKTKPKRIAYLMLPATNVEKFLSRFLLFTLGAGVVNFVAFVFADLLRMLALSGMWVRVNSAVPEAFCCIQAAFTEFLQSWSRFSYTGTSEGLYALFSFSLLLLQFVLFVLGSVLFRNRAFLKTAACLLGLGIFMSVLVSSVTCMSLKNTIFLTLVFDYWLLVITQLFFVLEVVLLWFSYRLFKRMQVVSRKFF